MKVFLSWSGDASHQLAQVFNAWLRDVMHYIKPYLSSEIPKGERWAFDIARELETTQFGIIFITTENVTAPWLNFEAGAISKAIEASRVAPFLFGIKPSELQGPLTQFQCVVDSKDEVEKLVSSINGAAAPDERLDPDLLKRSFERLWPDLQGELAFIDYIMTESAPEEPTPASPEMAVLNELLEISKAQLKILERLEYE